MVENKRQTAGWKSWGTVWALDMERYNVPVCLGCYCYLTVRCNLLLVRINRQTIVIVINSWICDRCIATEMRCVDSSMYLYTPRSHLSVCKAQFEHLFEIAALGKYIHYHWLGLIVVTLFFPQFSWKKFVSAMMGVASGRGGTLKSWWLLSMMSAGSFLVTAGWPITKMTVKQRGICMQVSFKRNT